MKYLKETVNNSVSYGVAKNIVVRVGRGDEVLADVYKSAIQKLNETTLFDIASITKIVVTTTLCYIAFDKGLISIDDKVSKFFDCPNDKKDLTIKNLLTHTMGIGHKNLTASGNTYDNIARYILNIPCDIAVSSDVLYSCPAFILLGKILEKVFNDRLDKLFYKYVAQPLCMDYSTFCPKETTNIVNSDNEPEFVNVVNDYNCKFLGGVAGNAGLFSNICDMTKYVKMLQRKGIPLFCKKTFEKGIKNYTPNMSDSRALGFVYSDGKYTRVGDLFKNGQIGHGGHTGQTLFLDTKTGLYVIILSDSTKVSGYESSLKMIENIHNAIKKDLKL